MLLSGWGVKAEEALPAPLPALPGTARGSKKTSPTDSGHEGAPSAAQKATLRSHPAPRREQSHGWAMELTAAGLLSWPAAIEGRAGHPSPRAGGPAAGGAVKQSHGASLTLSKQHLIPKPEQANLTTRTHLLTCQRALRRALSSPSCCPAQAGSRSRPYSTSQTGPEWGRQPGSTARAP